MITISALAPIAVHGGHDGREQHPELAERHHGHDRLCGALHRTAPHAVEHPLRNQREAALMARIEVGPAGATVPPTRHGDLAAKERMPAIPHHAHGFVGTVLCSS